MADSNLLKVDPNNLKFLEVYTIKKNDGTKTMIGKYMGSSTGNIRRFIVEVIGPGGGTVHRTKLIHISTHSFYKPIDPKMPPGAGAEGGRKTRKQRGKNRATRKKTSVFSK